MIDCLIKDNEDVDLIENNSKMEISFSVQIINVNKDELT